MKIKILLKIITIILIFLFFYKFKYYDHILLLFVLNVFFFLLFKKLKNKILFKLIFIFLIIFLLLEILITLNPIKIKIIEIAKTNLVLSRENNFYILDKELGYDLKPGAKNKDIKVNFYNRQVVYSGSYSINNLGNRNTGYNDFDYNTIFMGCSFTFGEGLNDDETLAFKMNDRKKFKTINTGVGGYGFLQSKIKTEKFINQNVENIVYFALPLSHSSRDNGFIKQKDKDQETNLDNYNKKKINNYFFKRIVDLMYYFTKFNTIKVIKYAKISINNKIQDKEEIQKNFLSELKIFKNKLINQNINFYIILYDYGNENKIFSEMLMSELNSNSDVFYLSEILKIKSEANYKKKYSFGLDGHPNAKLNNALDDFLSGIL